MLCILVFLFPVALSSLSSVALAAGPTYVSGTISGNTIWRAADSPYVVTGWVTVPSGSVLTVEPGTIVKFKPYYGIYVYGTLNAAGSTTDSVIFTSFKDDAYGGTPTEMAAPPPPRPETGATSRLLEGAAFPIMHSCSMAGGLLPAYTARAVRFR